MEKSPEESNAEQRQFSFIEDKKTFGFNQHGIPIRTPPAPTETTALPEKKENGSQVDKVRNENPSNWLGVKEELNDWASDIVNQREED